MNKCTIPNDVVIFVCAQITCDKNVRIKPNFYCTGHMKINVKTTI